MRYAAPRPRIHPNTRAPLDLTGSLGSVIAGDLSADAAYRERAVEPLGMSGKTLAVAPDRGLPKHCPVCGGAYGAFLSFGRARRRHAVCPGCGSLERHRFLWLYLREALRLPNRRMTILHIAPEPCIRTQLSQQPRIRYVAVDLYRPDVPHTMDVTDLTLPDSSIDLMLCSHVLEHVDQDRRALAEFARVLRPGGRAIILVPMDRRRATTFEDASIDTAAGRLAAFGHPYHVRICGADYGKRIAAAGFAVNRIDSDDLSAHRRRFYRLNKCSIFDGTKVREPSTKRPAD